MVFGPEGLGRARTDHILMKEKGFYRLSFSGDIEALHMPGGPTMVSLEMEVNSHFEAREGRMAGYTTLGN